MIGFWTLPNFPNNTGSGYFTEEQTQMAQYRMLVSAGGVSEDDEGDYWGGFLMGLRYVKAPILHLLLRRT